MVNHYRDDQIRRGKLLLQGQNVQKEVVWFHFRYYACDFLLFYVCTLNLMQNEHSFHNTVPAVLLFLRWCSLQQINLHKSIFLHYSLIKTKVQYGREKLLISEKTSAGAPLENSQKGQMRDTHNSGVAH